MKKKLIIDLENNTSSLVDMTAEENTARENEEAADLVVQADRKTARDNEIAAKTSGKPKLKSGDALTDAEIKALFGD